MIRETEMRVCTRRNGIIEEGRRESQSKKKQKASLTKKKKHRKHVEKNILWCGKKGKEGYVHI